MQGTQIAAVQHVVLRCSTDFSFADERDPDPDIVLQHAKQIIIATLDVRAQLVRDNALVWAIIGLIA